jgi:hypothetical protein
VLVQPQRLHVGDDAVSYQPGFRATGDLRVGDCALVCARLPR